MRINHEARRGTEELERRFYQDRYPNGYQHVVWADHVERVNRSVDYVGLVLRDRAVRTIADLSAGDGAIPLGIARTLDVPPENVILGDINPHPGRGFSVTGALPGTLGELSTTDPVDLYVCSETLEHLDDPDFLLEQLRARSRYLFVSTPADEPLGHGNHEHYWSWGTADLMDMLHAAGWSPIDYMVFTPIFRPESGYDFQMWVCE